jgi:hypothetical protein
MKVLDPGHIYELDQLGCNSKQTLTFVKKSSGAIQYPHDWPGVQTQEVLRALIDRTIYLNNVLPCSETQNALWHLRWALYEYEARAYRRKREGVNRTALAHDAGPAHADTPFDLALIETYPLGEDGHIDLEKLGEG